MQVDAGGPEAIETGGTLQIPDLAAGSHTILLARFAPNCTVAGDNPRTIDVPGGQTVAASFAVTCAPTTGARSLSAPKTFRAVSSLRTT